MSYSRILATILALISPFVFPWVVTLVTAALASVVFPPLGIVVGIMMDILYNSPATGIPYATIIGALVSGIGYVVHQFIKTRIME